MRARRAAACRTQFHDLLRLLETAGEPGLDSLFIWNGDYVDRQAALRCGRRPRPASRRLALHNASIMKPS